MEMLHANLSEKDFTRMSLYIKSHWGIKLPPAKRKMLESRLMKRLRRLNLNSFEDYCEYIFSPQGQENELVDMVNEVVTNETSFFRENTAFDYLTEKILPDYFSNQKGKTRKMIRIWSAGCSTGEEPYSIAMVLKEFAEKNPKENINFSILATDISTKVLEKAEQAIYLEERAKSIPPELKRKYLLKSKDPNQKQVRVAPLVRQKISFRYLNLMNNFSFKNQMDFIFCRNVIIYFDRPTQEMLLRRLCNRLVNGGYLFMGHAETLCNMKLPVTSVSPMIYRKSD